MCCIFKTWCIISLLFSTIYCLYHNFIFSAQRQAGLFLHSFFLHDLSLTWLENLHHFSNLHTNVQYNAIWLRRYPVIFGLMWCGINESSSNCLVLEAGRKWCLCHAISHACGIDYIGDVSTQILDFPLHQHWLLIWKWVRNVQCKWKICERNQYCSEIRHSKPTKKGEQIVDMR